MNSPSTSTDLETASREMTHTGTAGAEIAGAATAGSDPVGAETAGSDPVGAETAGAETAHAEAEPDSSSEANGAIVDLEHELGVMFSKVRAQVRKWAGRIHPDLSPAAYNVLATLVRSGPRHAGALSAALGIDKSVISRLIRQLGELGFVERRSDPADGRAFFVAATPRAERSVNEVRRQYRRRIRHSLEGWHVTDIDQLAGLLRRLNSEF